MPPKKVKPKTNFWEHSSSFKKQKLHGEVKALETVKENVAETLNEMDVTQESNNALLERNNELLEAKLNLESEKTRLESEIAKLKCCF